MASTACRRRSLCQHDEQSTHSISYWFNRCPVLSRSQQERFAGVDATVRGFIRQTRNLRGFIWQTRNLRGFIWQTRNFRGFIWQTRNFRGFIWQTRNFRGFTWQTCVKTVSGVSQLARSCINDSFGFAEPSVFSPDQASRPTCKKNSFTFSNHGSNSCVVSDAVTRRCYQITRRCYQITRRCYQTLLPDAVTRRCYQTVLPDYQTLLPDYQTLLPDYQTLLPDAVTRRKLATANIRTCVFSSPSW